MFVHIPKTGGQTIQEFFKMDKINCHPDQESTHLTAKMILDLYPEFLDYFKFSIVRNPLDRFVSEYFFSKRYRPYLLGTEEIEFVNYVNLRNQIYIIYKFNFLSS